MDKRVIKGRYLKERTLFPVEVHDIRDGCVLDIDFMANGAGYLKFDGVDDEGNVDVGASIDGLESWTWTFKGILCEDLTLEPYFMNQRREQNEEEWGSGYHGAGRIQINTEGSISVEFFNGTYITKFATAEGLILENTEYDIVFSVDRILQIAKIFVDGVKKAEGSVHATATMNGLLPQCFGRNTRDNNHPLKGYFRKICQWKRALSEDEAMSFTKNEPIDSANLSYIYNFSVGLKSPTVAADISGNGYDAEVVGAIPQFVTYDQSGEKNNGIASNVKLVQGMGDLKGLDTNNGAGGVSIPFDQSLYFSNDLITVLTLIKPKTSGALEIVLSQDTSIIIRTTVLDKFEFILNSFTTNDRLNGGSLEMGKWTLLGGVFDGTDIKIYQDGEKVGTITPTGVYVGTTGVWKLGHDTSEEFTGVLSEFQRIYKGKAFTDEEMRNINLFIKRKAGLI